MTRTAPRPYALIRRGAGSWLAVTDDGRSLFHLIAYDEDGSASTGDGQEIRGRYWRAERLTADTATSPRDVLLVERRDDGTIAAVDIEHVVEAGAWEDWVSVAPRRADVLRDVRRYAAP